MATIVEDPAVITATETWREHPAGALDALSRRVAHRLLRGVRGGRITVVDRDGSEVGFGDAGDGLSATVHVHFPAAYRSLLKGGLGVADAYAARLWDCDDLVALIRIASRSLVATDPLRHRLATLVDPVQRVVASRRSNVRGRSVDNVRRHYDLGNDFFSLVLDETMGYSCAYYERPGMAAVDASRANLERVCRLLDLRPGERLLELGSGWGGLAIHAARNFGCHVATVTISPNQREYIEAKAREAGVSDRVEVVLRDYRDVRGRWDKLVSLEMVESIGALHLHEFVAQLGRLLRDDGLVLLQTITTSHRLFETDRYHRTFLTERIFPGGCVPSLEAIASHLARNTDLRIAAVYDISAHYPPTLRAWRGRMQSNWPFIERLGGYGENFRRLWTLYFSWCEGAFLERRVQDRQVLLAGPRWRDENRLLDIETAAVPA